MLGASRWSKAANTLTISRIICAPILVALILHQNPWWLTFFLGWILGITDYVDGELARKAEPTRAGAFLDPLADKVLVLSAGMALVVIGRFHWLPIALITLRELGIQVYRSYWARRSLAIPARKSAKYKTFVQGLALSFALFPPFESSPYTVITDVTLWLAVGFTLFSGAQYVMDGRSALRTTGVR